MNYSYHAIIKSSGKLKPQEQYASCQASPQTAHTQACNSVLSGFAPFPCIACIVAGCQIVFPQQIKWNCTSCSDTPTHNNFLGVTDGRRACERFIEGPLTACHAAAGSYKGRAASYQGTSQQLLGKGRLWPSLVIGSHTLRLRYARAIPITH